MKRKSLLLYSTISLFIIGALFISYIFGATLNPSKKTLASYPEVDLRKLKQNTFIFYPHPIMASPERYTWHILFYKSKNNDIRAWNIPVKNNTVEMPDIHWWYGFHNCKKFGPTIINGLVDETKPITCHDKDTPEWWKKHWQWDINGKNIKGMVDDMNQTKGYMKNGYFKFFKNS